MIYKNILSEKHLEVLKKLKSLGGVVVITSVLQVFLTFVAGYFVALLLGFDTMNSIYAGLIIAFSSTMIVLKLIIDKDELSTIHGRILLGILFIQDILVILALTLIIGSESLSFTSILFSLLKFLKTSSRVKSRSASIG